MNLDDLVEALGARWEEEIHMLCERKRGTPALQEDLEPTKVFLVHGHDKHTRVEVENLLRKLGLDPIVLQDEPSRGQTIIEKFEQNAKSVAFAIVLLTPDDEGRPAGSERV